MDELDYIDNISNYRTYIKDFTSNTIATIRKFYLKKQRNTIPDEISSYFRLKKETILQQFSLKDRATWSLSPLTVEYGAWFDNSPLEILPEIPDTNPSSELIKLLDHFEDWGLKENKDLNNELIFENFYNHQSYSVCSKSDRLHRQWLGLFLLSLDKRPWTRDFLYNEGFKVHLYSDIRALILSLAFFDLPWVPAEKYLYDCTHDTDEVVFIKSFRICARIHDEKAMDNLRPIVKSPSQVLSGLMRNKMYYPVGHAACNICPAQFAIIGTDNPHVAKIREEELMLRNRRPLSAVVEQSREKLLLAINNFEQPSRPADIPHLGGMIKIPKGEFIYGMNPSEIQNEIFDWSTCAPQKKIDIVEFYIDEFPVTNAQYDEWEQNFSSLSEKERFQYEHPGQKINKVHRRNTFDDDRFLPDHPVVGIDWFDAWSFARFHNKDLPTEYQWEKAARGETSWRYPWGNEFDPRALRYASNTYNVDPGNIVEWIILLNKGTKTFPNKTTDSVFSYEKGVSPYGVYGLCGNTWEFTKTSFATGKDARLPFRNFSPIELMGTREGHVVIRGGAWSSPNWLIGSSYRGYDLLTDRHTEIGFRCVYNPIT